MLCLRAQSLVMSTLCSPMDTDLQVPFCPWVSPGKNTGVDCHALLQGFFQTRESNLWLLSLLCSRQVLYPLSHLGSTWGDSNERNCLSGTPFLAGMCGIPQALGKQTTWSWPSALEHRSAQQNIYRNYNIRVLSGGSALDCFHMFWRVPNLYISFFLIGGKLLFNLMLVSIFLNYKISKVKLGNWEKLVNI